ncbi:MAG: 30S ribosomal protein S20 [Parachlamydiales bacterium]|jgi:small subunit ribosomal protein S20
MAKQTDEKKGKVKRPTALKRDIQNSKRRLLNKAYKNQVKTAIRKLEETAKSKDEAKISASLNEVYSLVDKGVKRGVYKKNKASRTKSRLAAHAFASV